jgi:HK97 gp10 family phage protein
MADVKVKGLADLNKFLQQLPAKVEQSVLRGALRAGANVVMAEAKANVPVASGQLRDGLKISTSSRRGRVTAKVKATGKHAHIAPWLEYGTAAHKITAKKGKGLFFGGLFVKGVQHPGSRPKPFMRPALDGRAQDAVVAAAQYMKRRLATKNGLDTSSVEIEAE